LAPIAEKVSQMNFGPVVNTIKEFGKALPLRRQNRVVVNYYRNNV
jgi:glycerol-3-phosphate O-acyltransferase